MISRSNQAIQDDLTRVLEIAKAMTAEKDLGKLLDLIVRETTALIHADRSTIFLLDEKSGELYSRIAEGEGVKEIRFPMDKGIAGHVATTGEVVNIPDAYQDARFHPEIDKKTGYRTRSILCCPLLTHDNRIRGVIQVLNKQDGPFSKHDEQFILAAGSYAAVALDHARLVEHYLEKQRMEQSLAIAREIQQGLCPKANLQAGGVSIHSWCRPCDETGGDYYDYFRLHDDRIAVAMGDVSGHGMGPALLMASTRATLRGLAAVPAKPEALLTRLNRLLYEELGDERFVTLFYGVLDAQSGTLCYASAGHDPPLHVTADGGVQSLESTGLPLGIMDDSVFDPGGPVTLREGDKLVFGTDGLWEAANADGEEFGRERLVKAVLQRMSLPPGDIIHGIVADLEAFVGDAHIHDDLTLMIVSRRPGI